VGAAPFREPSRVAKTIGAAIRNARVRLKLTQEEAADRAGMSPPAFNRLERGDGDPRWSTVLRVARGLGLTLDELMSGSAERAAPAPQVPSATVRAELRAAKRDLAAAAKRIDDLERRLANPRRPSRQKASAAD
jgi:transcriptional regulator with XRE-family HTH domain